MYATLCSFVSNLIFVTRLNFVKLNNNIKKGEEGKVNWKSSKIGYPLRESTSVLMLTYFKESLKTHIFHVFSDEKDKKDVKRLKRRKKT